MHPEITFDAPLGWAKVVTQKKYSDIVAGGYTGGYAYPMGWKLLRQPKSGYSYLFYTPGWWDFLISPYINAPNVVLSTGGDGKPTGIIVLNKGLFNTKPNVGRGFMDGQPIPDPPWEFPPKAECLTSTLAIHKVLERKNGSTKIETFKLSDPAPDPLVYNYITTPWLFYRFMAVNPDDTLSYNWGNENNIPCISVDGYAWIEDEKLEFFKEYPGAAPVPPPPEEPMPEPTYGTNIDVSQFQKVKWKELPRVDLVTMRSNFGLNEDDAFRDNWKNAWYWSYHRQFYTWLLANFEPETLVNFIYDLMSVVGWNPQDGVPAIDFEDASLQGRTFAEALNKLEQMLILMDAAFGCKCEVYSRASFLSQASKAQLEFLRGRPLWLAGYPYLPTAEIPAGYLPPAEIYPGYLIYDLGWDKWQFAETMDFNGLVEGYDPETDKTYSGKGDANITRGTFEQYWARTGRTLRTDPRFVYRRKLHSLMAVTFPNSIGAKYAKHPLLDRRA